MQREFDKTREAENLDDIAARSLYAAGVHGATIRYCSKIYRRYLRGGSLLELGPAEGLMTAELAPLMTEYVAVEGSGKFAEALAKAFPTIEVVNQLFEEFEPRRRFDAIVLGHVLEHVQDPKQILDRLRPMLAGDGILLATVPNSRSLHRQAAVLMGQLQFEEELNDMDRFHGHRRVYNPETFRRDFLDAGFRIEVFGGYWLKPLSNAQIETTWRPEMLEAFMALGERYPDIAAEIYVVVRPANPV